MGSWVTKCGTVQTNHLCFDTHVTDFISVCLLSVGFSKF